MYNTGGTAGAGEHGDIVPGCGYPFRSVILGQSAGIVSVYQIIVHDITGHSARAHLCPGIPLFQYVYRTAVIEAADN